MPSNPGVYFFKNNRGKVLYVGKAKNLKKRVASYFTTSEKLGIKTKNLISQVKSIKTIKVESEIESLLLEANFIQKYRPRYNVRFSDSKAYPLIRITIKDKFPKVLVARRMEDPKSVYFGPYPNVSAMRLVLKIARRIFPYQSVLNHSKKLCLYHHLELCPCPEFLDDNLYKKSIFHLVNFLKGNTKKTLKNLEKEKEILIKEEKFENAGDLQKKIDSIKLITSPYYKPLDYEENPNLSSDLRNMEIEDLQRILHVQGISILLPRKIECFDISVISGKYATGSMVVFVNGEKDTSLYRRFKVRYTGPPNDFAMIEEVLIRRLNHLEWEFPNLIIVDGGKGQVSSALKVLKEKELNIPLIGLAKREEIIITSNFSEIRLSKDSKVLHLLQRIRDEAHRFAIKYHRKLRENFLNL